MLPSLQQTKELFKFITSVTDEQNVSNNLPKGTSRRHYQNVAFIASRIAGYSGLNVEKAFILGLLHDYGEYIEASTPETFHGTAGYDEMMRLGYDDVARTCLSHSFFDDNFKPEDFPAYDKKQIIRAAELLKERPFDDYDRLIHLADMMAPRDKIDTIENRIAMITEKYNLPAAVALRKKREALWLKDYFDSLTERNVYTLIGL